MPQEDALCREQGAVDALASHFELLAQLLRQAPAGEGLQALCTPLRESSAQLGRGLEERKEPRRKQSWDGATPDPGETVRAARSSEDPGDLHPASEHSHSAGPDDALPATSPPFVGTEHRRSSFSVGSSAASSKPQLRRSMSSIPTFSPNVIKRAEEWAEDQRVLQELRLGDSASEFGSDGDPVENASRAFHCLRGIVGNARYEVFWAAVVMVNTCTMILEEEWTGMRAGHRIGVYEQYGSEEYIDQWWPSAQAAFFAIDCVFSLMFTVELMLTFTYDVWNNLLGFGIHFRHPFWTNPWDWLDFVIVVSSNLALLVGFSDGPVSKARFFRIFRLVRLLRLVRLVRKINSLDPLHLMTTAIAGSAVALVFSILLLLLIQTMFAMILTQVLRYGWLSEESSPLSEGVQMQLFRYFGTYTRSMVTMFELMLANWPKVGRFLMEDVHEVFGYVVVVYKLSIGFAVIAVINGVFIQETFSVAQNDEFIMVRKRLRQMEHHKQTISRLFKMGDKDKSGTLSRAELGRLLKKRAIRTWLEAMDLRCSDPDMLFTLIAGDEDEVGLDAFVAGLGRLKGTARNIDMIAVLDILQQHQQSIMNDLQMLVKDIRRSPPEAPRAQARGPDEELPA